MSETRAARRLNAPPARVYAALVDVDAIPRWKVPHGMTGRVDSFDGREFRVSLTYEATDRAGKTSGRTDTSINATCDAP